VDGETRLVSVEPSDVQAGADVPTIRAMLRAGIRVWPDRSRDRGLLKRPIAIVSVHQPRLQCVLNVHAIGRSEVTHAVARVRRLDELRLPSSTTAAEAMSVNVLSRMSFASSIVAVDPNGRALPVCARPGEPDSSAWPPGAEQAWSSARRRWARPR
jgi:hypothetical protein